MDQNERMAAYWRAKEREYRAIAEAFSLDPMYDNDNEERTRFVETYEGLAVHAAGCAEACVEIQAT